MSVVYRLPKARYWVQLQQPSGEWSDYEGFLELEEAKIAAQWCNKTYGVSVQVVDREEEGGGEQ